MAQIISKSDNRRASNHVSAPDEAEIIRLMRAALDVLKDKLQESEGAWLMVEFMNAALNPDDERSKWVRVVTEAERLSNPYIKAGKKRRVRAK